MAWSDVKPEAQTINISFFSIRNSSFSLFCSDCFSPAAAAHVKCVRLEARFLSCPKLATSPSGMTPRNFKLLPRKVSKSCKFINVMTDYYHSQQPSAARQDKTKFWLHLWLVSKLPRQANISGYKTTWFLKSFSQETYSRVLSLDKRLHKGLSHETKSTFKFLADLKAHCAGAKTNKIWEISLVVPSCDVLCHCLPHT